MRRLTQDVQCLGFRQSTLAQEMLLHELGIGQLLATGIAYEQLVISGFDGHRRGDLYGRSGGASTKTIDMSGVRWIGSMTDMRNLAFYGKSRLASGPLGCSTWEDGVAVTV